MNINLLKGKQKEIKMRFQLSTNDREDFYMAFHGKDFYYALWELDQDVLRHKIKYDENLTEEQLAIYQEVRDKLYEIMSEHGIDFEHIS
jgi:hypothetical protein